MKKTLFLIFLFLSIIFIPVLTARPIEVTYRYNDIQYTRTATQELYRYEKIKEHVSFNISTMHKQLYWFLHWHLKIMPGTYGEVRVYNLASLLLVSVLAPRILKPLVIRMMNSITHMHMPMEKIRQIYTMGLLTATELYNRKIPTNEIYIPTSIEVRNLPRHLFIG